MTTESLRTLESIHGWLGWASIFALAIPGALLLRSRRPRVDVVVACTAFATLVATLGGVLYAYYTPMLKRAVYVASFRNGVLMERKEHLAVAALALAWCGCLCFVAGDDGDAHDDGRRTRTRIAHTCFVVASMLALVIAVIGATVASTRTF